MDLLDELDELVDRYVLATLGPRPVLPTPCSAADIREQSTQRTRVAVDHIGREIDALDRTATTGPELRQLRLLHLIRTELAYRLAGRRSLAVLALDAAERA